jgi:hypothetical protein
LELTFNAKGPQVVPVVGKSAKLVTWCQSEEWYSSTRRELVASVPKPLTQKESAYGSAKVVVRTLSPVASSLRDGMLRPALTVVV